MALGNINRFRSWFVSAGIITVVTIWLLSGQFGGNEETEQATAETVATTTLRNAVRVRTQSAEEVMRTIVVNGKTAPARITHLEAETDGRIEYVGAERGASLNTGDLIVRLDERDRSARLAQAEATVRQREVEYEARERLKSESYVSEAQLQEAIALLETARAELKRAQLDLGYMAVRAPFAGALQARHVEVGDFVKRGDPIATYVDNRTIIVSANVSEFDTKYVHVDETAEARLATGETVRGRIRYVAPVADESTRTFTVELEVANTNGKLRAGGTAELRIPAQTVFAHRVSPSLLTLDDAGNVGVKIINDRGEVEFVVADIALSSNDGVWLAGLPETATIITVGQGYVTSGAVVDAVPEGDAETAVAIMESEDAK
ncbi:MAG: efflux RND transporter periplasmic adaptor subunit [Gammaproteobacteria bacterium]|jgi:multidrug efflux system membrane fusion protein|nr:efflux RND transporter periplasmic adaptor subunit [Gammaproteobacteria bacterium]MDH3777287.1 efflux RND transporter periplasmic adaptor subunit [Gammaproteobacteria bacterium]MDH3811478.1 efflux RND transporter periplasmic adaptor subunit [Gammaproteobacteria bacterium]MDH3860613.1 efflux RND transporter periplasmic adaptor subunit [Gammaproteobacteria bacterium]